MKYYLHFYWQQFHPDYMNYGGSQLLCKQGKNLPSLFPPFSCKVAFWLSVLSQYPLPSHCPKALPSSFLVTYVLCIIPAPISQMFEFDHVPPSQAVSMPDPLRRIRKWFRDLNSISIPKISRYHLFFFQLGHPTMGYLTKLPHLHSLAYISWLP